MLARRVKFPTPRPTTPDAVAQVGRQLTTWFVWSGPAGIAHPGVVVDGLTCTSANLHSDWIGLNVQALLGHAAGSRPSW
jgi:polyphosphate glucokinase